MEIGNIVTVTLQESFLRGCQGEIAEIKNDRDVDGPIGVRLGRHCSHLFGCEYNPNNAIRFMESDLRVDGDYTSKNKANMLFPRMWHSLYSYKEQLDSEKLCMHEKCHEKRQRRIMVNVWGCATEVDVCNTHADQYHGKCIEIFPYRQKGE